MIPLQRLRRSLTTLPDARGWALCGLVAVIVGSLMAAIGFSTGLYALTPTAPGLPSRLLVVLFVPALGEEIPFRGLLVPGRDETRRPWAGHRDLDRPLRRLAPAGDPDLPAPRRRCSCVRTSWPARRSSASAAP
jgi:hypothetical protein